MMEVATWLVLWIAEVKACVDDANEVATIAVVDERLLLEIWASDGDVAARVDWKSVGVEAGEGREEEAEEEEEEDREDVEREACSRSNRPSSEEEEEDLDMFESTLSPLWSNSTLGVEEEEGIDDVEDDIEEQVPVKSAW